MIKVLGARLTTNKISYIVSNKNPCLQITLKNPLGNKKTNVDKRRQTKNLF